MTSSINVKALTERIGEHFSEPKVLLEEYQQGGCHMTYIATLSNQRRVFVRVQRTVFASLGLLVAPVSDYKMSSEVATLRFLQARTDIPVPSVFFHDKDTDHMVGAEWMVIEYMDGVNLQNVWDEMSFNQREQVCLEMADVWTKIIQLSFDTIGSLYESKDGDFYVGPIARLASDNAYSVAPPAFEKSGPFSSPRDWLLATARRDLDYVSSYQRPEDTPLWIKSVVESLSRSDELRLCPSLPASRIALEHIDFSPHNVLVDPADHTRIVSVIDWEAARIVPLWAMNPRFVWPSENIPEQNHLKALMRERIISRVPEWQSATGVECERLRELQRSAQISDLDPDVIKDFSPSSHLFMTDPW